MGVAIGIDPITTKLDDDVAWDLNGCNDRRQWRFDAQLARCAIGIEPSAEGRRACTTYQVPAALTDKIAYLD